MTAIDVYALPSTPWKNGGGSTRTIAVSPPDAVFDDFDWRISIAEVSSSGDFSRFPGVDRTILLLDGAGMTLHINDQRVVPLTTPFEPHSFSGDDAVRSALVNGSSRDFNVMTRRGRAQAEVKIAQSAFRSDASAAVCFCARGSFSMEEDGTLGAGWALRTDRPQIHFEPQTPDALLIAVLIKLTENS